MKNLRLGVGVVGVLLPVLLIAGNWVAGDKPIVPASMSASYYTSSRNLFVGLLCALGVFLVFYRYTTLQYLCTLFAGVCALSVAFAPTAPPRPPGWPPDVPPPAEPAWINYVHHIAAGALIFTLGVFCFVLQRSDAAGLANVDPAELGGQARRPPVPRWRTWLYFICGGLVLLSGGLALYTGFWPTSWSTGWPSCYLFEAVAVSAFGIAWITAAAVRATTIQKRVVDDLERRAGDDSAARTARTAWASLAAMSGPAGLPDPDPYKAAWQTIKNPGSAAAPPPPAAPPPS